MLKRVKIQGYKSLVDVEVNLQPLSVLFGINATGKSNFLDALQLLSRIATSRELREAFEPPYELRQHILDLQSGKQSLSDLFIVATDGNCKNYSGRKQEIDKAVKGFSGPMIYVIPDPHIEKWLLLDSSAFKKVLGEGCQAPPNKCERDLYKRLLRDAVRNALGMSTLSGIEHTEALVNAMDLDYLERTEESLGKLLKALRHKFQEWARTEEHPTSSEPPTNQSPQP